MNMVLSPNSHEVIVMGHMGNAQAYHFMYRASTTANSFQSLDGVTSSFTLFSQGADDYNAVINLHQVTHDLWAVAATTLEGGNNVVDRYRFPYNSSTGNWTITPDIAENWSSSGQAPTDAAHLNGAIATAIDITNNTLYFMVYTSSIKAYMTFRVESDGNTRTALPNIATPGNGNIGGLSLAVINGTLTLFGIDDHVTNTTNTGELYSRTFNGTSWSAASSIASLTTVTGTATFSAIDNTTMLLFGKTTNDLWFYSKIPLAVTASGPSISFLNGQTTNYTASASGGTESGYTFSWSLNGKPVGTGSSLNLNLTKSGTLTVTLTDSGSNQISVSLSITLVVQGTAKNIVVETNKNGFTTGRIWVDGKAYTMTPNPGQIATVDSATGNIFFGVEGEVDSLQQSVTFTHGGKTYYAGIA
jgi:hypothetical protein